MTEEPHKRDSFFQRPDRLHDPLYVLTAIFNPVRFRSRWKLYEDFEKEVADAGAILYTVEIATGDRDFVVTQRDNPRHLQLRSVYELWFKEKSLNLLAERLPPECRKFAVVDADISFGRRDWANETIHALEHYSVVQMWSEAHDLSPNHEIVKSHHSFVYSQSRNAKMPPNGYYYHEKSADTKFIEYHPGFAWAFRKEAFNALGGLIDWAILGAADTHQARALFNNAQDSMHPSIQGTYRKWVMQWQERAQKHIVLGPLGVGYVPGTILHFHHGPKAKRFYWDRWRILVETNFDPETDLKRDHQGLWQLVIDTPRQARLRDLLKQYLRSRDEDSLEI